jgi:hypothetical protein
MRRRRVRLGLAFRVVVRRSLVRLGIVVVV